MKMKFILLLFAATVFSCGDDTTVSTDATDNTDTTDETEAPIFNPPNVLGMDYTKSKVSVDDTYAALRSSLEANPNISIMAEVDHQANAASVDQEFSPTKIIFFGGPNLGTPLMQKNQLAGLDLPQKMLVWTDGEGVAHVAYNDPAFLVKRHGIMGNEEVLKTITGALDKLAGVAVGEE